ncbi:DUF4013 domain-containing protein [Halostagnicola bangensis]
MIVNALKYPLEDDDYPKTLLIGSLLLVTSFLIIPAFILTGYITRAVQNASKGLEPPQFEDYVGLLIDGLKLTGVFLIYFVAFMLAAVAMLLVQELNRTAGLALFWVLLVPSYFGLIYGTAAITYHFSRERRISDALKVGAVARTALSLRYLAVFLLVILIGPILFLIFQVALAFTIIGLLLVPATLIYEFIVYSKLMGEVDGPARRSSA